MTPAELTAALDQLDLTAYALAKMVGYSNGGAAIRRQMLGKSPVNPLLAHVVRAMLGGYRPN